MIECDLFDSDDSDVVENSTSVANTSNNVDENKRNLDDDRDYEDALE